jgi:hypothetical protein
VTYYDSHHNGSGVDYLAKAAALLDKAAETNELKCRDYWTNLNAGRERIAGQYAQLGAIQRGLLPADMAKQILDAITASR